MGVQLVGSSGNVQEVAAYKRSAYVSERSPGASYALSSITGTVAAALGIGSTVFAMRNSPTSGKVLYITKFRIRWTAIVAFTTPITSGRRLAIYRGSGAAAAGGTALATAMRKNSADGASGVDTATGGDARIATTAALTVTGITYEAQEIRTMALTGFGAAGATVEDIYEFNGNAGGPVELKVGELLGVRNPVAMDAAGTWQIDVDVDWFELATGTV